MSPHATCPKCGKEQLFHESELKDVRAGTAICTECSLERGYNTFLAEILQGKHQELTKKLKERMKEEEDA